MELMNWPPSRGPNNPHAPVEVIFEPGEVSREDVVREEKEGGVRGALKEIEEAAVENPEAELPSAVAPDPEPDDLPEGVVERIDRFEDGGECHYRRPGWSRPKRAVEGIFCCNYHVETVATLTLQQAVSLLHVREKVGEQIRNLGRERFPVKILADSETEWGSHEFEPRTFSVLIDYPLRVGVRLTVPPMTRRTVWRDPKENAERVETSPGYLFWVVAREYQRIYREHEKYQVWGHAIDDLWFEGLEISGDGLVQLWMGS
jgi:hypothetical protein